MKRLPARLHPRLIAAALTSLAVFLLLPRDMLLNSRMLIGWDCGILIYLASTASMAARSTVGEIQARARLEDEGAPIILVLSLVAAIASLVAIVVELRGIQSHDPAQAFRLIVAGVTILCSWFFVHTIFAIHYAHEYYGDDGGRGGLTFQRTIRPDYWDFLYFSFNFGAAAQTSDIIIASKRMRRLALGHTILSFLFNTTILALAVNVGAGLF